MPIARFEMPDGRVARFEVPAGLSPEDAQNLINEESLWQIDRINNIYSKKVKDAKSINKKYDKSKKLSYNV